MKIYVASSWRNQHQPQVVQWLRESKHEVYDFRHPKEGDGGFSWSQLEKDMGKGPDAWSPEIWLRAMDHPSAKNGFKQDTDALLWCDTVLLVLPCGKSAHLELGYGIGAGKKTAIYFPKKNEWPGYMMWNPPEPELMYRMADKILMGPTALHSWMEEKDATSSS